MITLREKICYSLGDFANNIIIVLLPISLGITLGFSPVVIGSFMLGSFIVVSIFSDLYIGYITDKIKHTKFGSSRYCLLIFSIPAAILGIILFIPHITLPTSLQYIIFFIIHMIIYPFLNLPYSVLNAKITDDKKERFELNIFRMGGAVVMMILTFLFVSLNVMTPASIILVGSLPLLYLAVFLGTKERVKFESNYTLKDIPQIFTKAYILTFLSYAILVLRRSIFLTLLVFGGLISPAAFLYSLLIGLVICYFFAKKINKETLLDFSNYTSILVLLALFIGLSISAPTIFITICLAFSGFLLAIHAAVAFPMVMDTIYENKNILAPRWALIETSRKLGEIVIAPFMVSYFLGGSILASLPLFIFGTILFNIIMIIITQLWKLNIRKIEILGYQNS